MDLIGLLVAILVLALVIGIFVFAFRQIPGAATYMWVVYVVIAIFLLIAIAYYGGDYLLPLRRR